MVKLATTYTEHLQIPKHSPTDPFNIALINEGFDKTEAGILAAYRGGAAYNLLDNSNFRNPVNQRGKTTYTGNGYSIDRWRAYHASTTHTVTASGLSVSATDNNPNIYQVLDPNVIDTDKTYTVAVCDSAGNVSVRTMKPTTTAYSPACIYISGSNILFRIVGNNTWRWAALYEGEYILETLPSYVPKGYAAELAECQRYYWQYQHNNGMAVGTAYMNATTEAYVTFAFPQTMRTTPTISINDISTLRLMCVDGMKGVTAYTVNRGTPNQLGVTFTTNSSGTVYTPCVMRSNSGTIIAFSADL